MLKGYLNGIAHVVLKEDSEKFRVFVSGQTFRSVVSHSMSGTLMPVFEGLVLFSIIIIFYLLFEENLIELQPYLKVILGFQKHWKYRF